MAGGGKVSWVDRGILVFGGFYIMGGGCGLGLFFILPDAGGGGILGVGSGMGLGSGIFVVGCWYGLVG